MQCPVRVTLNRSVLWCTLYRDWGARTATERLCAVARYYDISSKADSGDIFNHPQSKIIISHTPTSPWSTKEVECKCSASYPEVVFWKLMYECCQHCCRGWRGVWVSLSVLRPYATHWINWSASLSSQKEASSKDDAQESPQTVCWRQAD